MNNAHVLTRLFSILSLLSFLCSACLQTGKIGEDRAPLRDETLGGRDAVNVVVTASSGSPICQSFAFSQIPRSPDLFIGKLKTGTAEGVCAGHLTLAVFRMNWNKHVMIFLHTVMQVPATAGTATIADAYDPYAVEFNKEIWVAFECTGPHIPGTSSCIAPLVGDADRIDLARLSVPVVGLDSDPNSPWGYSASTPKLLNFKDHLYLYWTAIQSDKSPPHHWNSIETRGAEVEIESDGARQMWIKGRVGRPQPAHAPGSNIAVLVPDKRDPYGNTTVDTEGFLVVGDRIVVLNSVGGAGPDGRTPCVKPPDKSPGCFRLEITRTDNPLSEDAFRQETLIIPKLPANPMEYPRIVIAPDNQTYLLMNSHPLQVAPVRPERKAIDTGLLLVPLPIQSLRFETESGK